MKTPKKEPKETPLQKETRLFHEAVARGDGNGYPWEDGENILPEDAKFDMIRAMRKALERKVGTADLQIHAR